LAQEHQFGIKGFGRKKNHLTMAHNLGVYLLLSWMTALATSIGTDPNIQMLIEPLTKHVKGVPIFNYQFALNLNRAQGLKEPRNCTTWFVMAHKEYAQELRDFCIKTSLGKRHCRYVAQSTPSFIFEGSEDELHVMLDVHKDKIEFVEPDHEVFLFDNTHGPEPPGILQNDPEWGLDRIDQFQPGLSKTYEPGLDGGFGTGVHVYVTDTGVMTTHEDLEGRAIPTLESLGHLKVCDPSDTSCALDPHGHGSHCSGIIGGKKYGVAKNVTIHAVQVLGSSGFGQYSWIYMAIDWIVKNHIKPAVISSSLGGYGASAASKKAIDAAVEAGITVVVAAGNNAMDACMFQPSFVPSAITVGATEPSVGNHCNHALRKALQGSIGRLGGLGDRFVKSVCGGYDNMAFYSNYGTCLDIWAPGSDIASIGIASNHARKVMSGTSMACPAVAGASALVLAYFGGITPAEVKLKLQEHATVKTLMPLLLWPKPDSVNNLLYIGKKGWSKTEVDSLLASEGSSTLMGIFMGLIGIPSVVAGFVIHRKSAAAREIKTRPLLG